MKLAEALLLRGDIQKKLASLRERIGRNCLVQEGNAPHENPSALFTQGLQEDAFSNKKNTKMPLRGKSKAVINYPTPNLP